ncbi:MAG: O-succinylhomoserine sulfhydrylase [Alphaproteobacteria bacterium HGW-Alphaproteobacteria-2]|nr:MAG: O-succinylhomoserine sulfhydrylase [Alphaproteobacteria bacterium HGW-Alphaproteobacteria-2]
MHDWSERTKLVHAGTRRSQYGEMSEAIFLTQGFAYDSAAQAEARFKEAGPDEFVYARYGNPTVAMFEERIAALEGAEDAFATASGMAAVHAALFSMLGTDLAQWRAAIRSGTKAVFFESLSNPALEVIDIAAVAEIAHAAGALVIADNVFATPVLQRSLALGADVVIYSATKHIDGQGRCLGGVVLGNRDFIRGTLEPFLKHTGGAMSPFTAWVMLKGMETLDLRVRAQAASAAAIADHLAARGDLARVIFPFLPSHPQQEVARRQMQAGGTLVSFDLGRDKEATFRFLDALQIILISNNLGDAKSIATHPATTTHSRLPPEARAALGITDGLVRLSVGLEGTADLIADIDRALAAV